MAGLVRWTRSGGCLGLVLMASHALAQGIEVTIDRAEATVVVQLVVTV